MNVDIILPTIPWGSLLSYRWVAGQLGWGDEAAHAAGQAIALETKRRWRTPSEEEHAANVADFPWWRVVGADGEIRTIWEKNQAWYERQGQRLLEEEHVLAPSLKSDGLRVARLPLGFE